MRNVFDQFSGPENRLTHALATALFQDSKLLKDFVQWMSPAAVTVGSLAIAEQTLPGEEQISDEDLDLQQNSLPDMWIYDEGSWSLIIESKIGTPLTARQLSAHREMARRRGYPTGELIGIVVERPANAPSDVKLVKWTEIYQWLRNHASESKWAQHAASYMEILERKLIGKGQLTRGTLTVFAGFPFGARDQEEVYNAVRAKQLLQLACDGLRSRSDLNREYGVSPASVGRPITATSPEDIWDYIPIVRAKGRETFTNHPHLSLGVQSRFVQALVILPNSAKASYLSNLRGSGFDDFAAVFGQVAKRLSMALSRVDGATPIIELLQRRYASLKSEAYKDGELTFDLRTAFNDNWPTAPTLKVQPLWLEFCYRVLASKKGNLQLAVGVRFDYARCKASNSATILDHIAATWIACKPLFRKMVALPASATQP